MLFVTRKFPPLNGGMERMAYYLYKGLCDIAEVTLVKWTKHNVMVFLGYLYLLLNAVHRLMTKKYDMVYLQDGLLAPIGVVLKAVLRKPVIITVHGLDITYKNPFYQALIPTMISMMDGVITVSHATRYECISRGVVPSRIHIVPNGIHMPEEALKYMTNSELGVREPRRRLEELTGASENTTIILMVGRMVERKGFHWFIENVMPKVVEHNCDVICVHIGDGEFRYEIENAIKRVKVENHVRLLGKLNDEDLYNAYLGADIFVMPNIHVEGDFEGFGLVAVEASFFGLPVIASDADGVTTAIAHKKNGFQCKEKDADCFLQNITDLIDNTNLREAFGKQAQEFTKQNYNWHSVAGKYVTVFSRIIT